MQPGRHYLPENTIPHMLELLIVLRRIVDRLLEPAPYSLKQALVREHLLDEIRVVDSRQGREGKDR